MPSWPISASHYMRVSIHVPQMPSWPISASHYMSVSIHVPQMLHDQLVLHTYMSVSIHVPQMPSWPISASPLQECKYTCTSNAFMTN